MDDREFYEIPLHDLLARKLDGLMLEPDDPKRYNEIGIILSDLGERELASMYFHRGYQLVKDQPEQEARNSMVLWENYGSVLYLLGQFEEALVVYQEALQIQPENEAIIEKLGTLYYLLGNDTLSVRCFQP